MTKDDVLFGYRQQLFAEAARTNVSAACRTFGVHRSTYYHWKRQVDRHGLEMLRPRERRRPQMPNAFPKMIEERIVSFSIAHPGLGLRRVSSGLAREKWDGIIVSANGVWKVLCRHGLNTRAKRLGLIAGYAAPTSRPEIPHQNSTLTSHSRVSWSGSCLLAIKPPAPCPRPVPRGSGSRAHRATPAPGARSRRSRPRPAPDSPAPYAAAPTPTRDSRPPARSPRSPDRYPASALHAQPSRTGSPASSVAPPVTTDGQPPLSPHRQARAHDTPLRGTRPGCDRKTGPNPGPSIPMKRETPRKHGAQAYSGTGTRTPISRTRTGRHCQLDYPGLGRLGQKDSQILASVSARIVRQV
jgi:transposase